MEVDEILALAIDAIREFLEKDADLLDVNINERTLTARLMLHLQVCFGFDWHVDCEYNRLGDQIKRLPDAENIRSDDPNGKTIFPDIIVHLRRTTENLLLLEMKKTANPHVRNDYVKLERLTHPEGPYAYRCGVHLILDAFERNHRGSVYVRGAVDEDRTRTFNENLTRSQAA